MTRERTSHQRHGRIVLIASGVLLLLYVVIFFMFPGIDAAITNAVVRMREYALHNGMWGLFVFSLFANVTVFINIPYSSAAVLLGGLGLHPWLIAVVAGFGAMIGQWAAYLVGYGGGRMIARGQEGRFDAMRKFLEQRRYLTPWLVFFFAAIPIPDEMLLIPLGVIRYPFLKMILPMFFGKVIQNYYFALLGKYSLGRVVVESSLGNGFWVGFISLLLVFGALYITVRIDWERVMQRWTRSLPQEKQQ